MSKGIGGLARLVSVDADTIVYEYYSYNLNDPKYANRACICDGLITLPRDYFPALPKDKKELTDEDIPHINNGELIECGKITVKNCSHSWRLIDCYGKTIDFIVYHLLYHLAERYYKERAIPVLCGYDV